MQRRQIARRHDDISATLACASTSGTVRTAANSIKPTQSPADSLFPIAAASQQTAEAAPPAIVAGRPPEPAEHGDQSDCVPRIASNRQRRTCSDTPAAAYRNLRPSAMDRYSCQFPFSCRSSSPRWRNAEKVPLYRLSRPLFRLLVIRQNRGTAEEQGQRNKDEEQGYAMR